MSMLAFVAKVPGKVLEWLIIGLIAIYRLFISPVLHLIAPGSGCRFEPSCSAYALEAVRKHGAFRGTWLAVKRLAKCHPWGSYGFDPVPDGCSCTNASDHQHASPFGHSHSQSDPARNNQG